MALVSDPPSAPASAFSAAKGRATFGPIGGGGRGGIPLFEGGGGGRRPGLAPGGAGGGGGGGPGLAPAGAGGGGGGGGPALAPAGGKGGLGGGALPTLDCLGGGALPTPDCLGGGAAAVPGTAVLPEGRNEGGSGGRGFILPGGGFKGGIPEWIVPTLPGGGFTSNSDPAAARAPID